MPLRSRPLVVRLAALLTCATGIAYGGAVGYLKLNEHELIYIPANRQVRASEPRLRLSEQQVTYPSTGGVTLSAWIVPAGANRSGLWLLICHGNYGNIGFGGRPRFYALMRDLGLDVFAFDYRGYGASTGTPDEQGLYDDALASFEYLTGVLRIPPRQVVIFGHSLGTGVAIELASKVPAGGLIVEAPYTSIVDVGQERYPLIPVGLIASQRFPSLERIASVEMPKLFLHSPEDGIIPIAHGRRLFAAAREPKRFVVVRGGHDEAYDVDRDVYVAAVGAFLDSLH